MRPRAARFDDVGEADAAAQIAYLDEQAATPFWRERKAHALELLELRPGTIALDAGCGTGDDVRAMAARCGRAIGVDRSHAMVAEARRRNGAGSEFRIADVQALPFGDDSFDAVRIERTLQHVADPAAAVRELARVARSGAAVVAIEPDWETLALEAAPREVTEAVRRAWAASIPHPSAGRDLPALMADAGLERVETRTDTSVIADLAFAQRQFALDELVASAGVPAEAAREWRADLADRAAGGRFRAEAGYVTARGFAPG